MTPVVLVTADLLFSSMVAKTHQYLFLSIVPQVAQAPQSQVVVDVFVGLVSVVDVFCHPSACVFFPHVLMLYPRVLPLLPVPPLRSVQLCHTVSIVLPDSVGPATYFFVSLLRSAGWCLLLSGWTPTPHPHSRLMFQCRNNFMDEDIGSMRCRQRFPRLGGRPEWMDRWKEEVDASV